MDDATEALRLQPDNVKALFRRALGKKVCFIAERETCRV